MLYSTTEKASNSFSLSTAYGLNTLMPVASKFLRIDIQMEVYILFSKFAHLSGVTFW